MMTTDSLSQVLTDDDELASAEALLAAAGICAVEVPACPDPACAVCAPGAGAVQGRTPLVADAA